MSGHWSGMLEFPLSGQLAPTPAHVHVSDILAVTSRWNEDTKGYEARLLLRGGEHLDVTTEVKVARDRVAFAKDPPRAGDRYRHKVGAVETAPIREVEDVDEQGKVTFRGGWSVSFGELSASWRKL